MITNEIESFTCKNVLYADILGFSNLISKHREKADTVLTELRKIDLNDEAEENPI